METARDQLIHSERLAAMGQLAASIVHELNNPLMVVVGYVDLLLGAGRTLDPKSRQYLQIVCEQSEALRRLVQDILNFSRRQMTPFGPVDVKAVVTTVTLFLGNILKRKIGSMPLRLADDLPVVRGDAQQIQQVFANILTNAGDAMVSRGSVTVTTSCLDAAALWEDLHHHDGVTGAT
ncbi:MAG: hypothetical protein FJY97_06505 [candidate division Zixibacteria bacterium]|nr:hypothetical protein [candidate division Zixibacteria bacterium]